MPASDATQRFSSRVENYVRYRPGYPQEVIKLLKRECGLISGSIIADIAFGTGIFTSLLLANGNPVYGVEPNADMRQAGESFLAGYPRFTSLAGTAENTTLAAKSVDFVTAAQAAHWFDLKKARQEFIRITEPGGWTVLLWNERSVDSTPFLRAYEELVLNFGTDYKEVRHERTTETIHEFFSPTPFHSHEFDNHQEIDYAGLEGRLLSSSYTPAVDHPNHQPMLATLRRIFDEYQVGGKVSLEYKTRVYYAQLT
jgi:ubiquinone/menaquinone biosynthesis C-methylase UbiE